MRIKGYAVKGVDAKSRFVSVALSYWIPERLALVPIIGHELAHQVLRSTYGREGSVALLEQDQSQLGRLYRRLTKCAETWLSRRVEDGELDARFVSYLVTEILCDVFAAVRFGYAYAYAWMLETLSEERFSHLFHDEYGMLRRVKSVSPTAGTADEGEKSTSSPERNKDLAAEVDELKSDAFAFASHLRRSMLAPLYRGRVLLAVLEQLRLEQDEVAKQFGDAFNTLLSVMLDVYTSGAEVGREAKIKGRQAYEDEFARDLASVVCEERLFDSSGKFGESEFVRLSREFWKGLTVPGNTQDKDLEASLERQLLSLDYRELLVRMAKPMMDAAGVEHDEQAADQADSIPSSSPFKLEHCRTLVDSVWRTEWLMERAKSNTKANSVTVDVLRNHVRELTFLGMDDYLFRTASPSRLFSVVADEEGKKTALRVVKDKTNSLHNDVIKSVYDKVAIKQLDVQFESVGTEKVAVSLCGEAIHVERSQRRWLPDKIVDPKGLQSLVGELNGSSRPRLQCVYSLDLMRVRANGGILGSNMSVVTAVKKGSDSKYRVLNSGALLGRYDAFVLYQQDRSDGELNWAFAKREEATSESIQAPYVSRTKRLVRVAEHTRGFDAVLDDSQFQPVALILISLKWDASRTVMARWLTSEKGIKIEDNGAKFAVFLSDGWEDMVVVVGKAVNSGSSDGLQPVQGGKATASVAEQCLKSINLINQNPFVSGTETLFTTDLLVEAPKNVRFRFACRSGALGYAAARAKFQNVVRGIAPSLIIMDVAGNKDFELPVDGADADKVKELHHRLHVDLPGGCRLETRVMWGHGEPDEASRSTS